MRYNSPPGRVMRRSRVQRTWTALISPCLEPHRASAFGKSRPFQAMAVLAAALLALEACNRRSNPSLLSVGVGGSEASSVGVIAVEDVQQSPTMDAMTATAMAMDAASVSSADDASAPVAADASGGAPSLNAARACAGDGECVLVTGGCMGPMAAHREEAAEIDARNQRILSNATCDGRFIARPVRAGCSAGRCALVPLDHVEWRSCQSTRECTPVHRNCQRFEAVSRRFEREAREAMNLSQPCGPIVVPPAPRIECRFGWCVAGWAGR